MTDDDREGFEPEDDSQAGDPAQAFDALRRTIETQGAQLGAEMTVIRRGVEAAFDQFEKFQQPPDYGPDLDRVVQQLGLVAERLEAVEQSPVLRQGPEHYARALERSGESLVRTAAQQLENESRDLQRMTRDLAGHVASARERRIQHRYLWGIGAAGIVAGILLTLFLPTMLPGQLDTHVAGFIMGQDRWNAGITMMQTADPDGWRGVVEASNLVRENAEALRECAEAARAAGEDQQCTITVRVSVSPGQ
ncbi:MAG: DUF6118 family protein [Pseudorhodoplanes sp.]